jgi:CBS-domain-containing membrane protein
VSDIVIWYEHQGLTADSIVSQAPGLTLADVHAALAYYYENLDQFREEMRAELAAADRYQPGNQSILPAKLVTQSVFLEPTDPL